MKLHHPMKFNDEIQWATASNSQKLTHKSPSIWQVRAYDQILSALIQHRPYLFPDTQHVPWAHWRERVRDHTFAAITGKVLEHINFVVDHDSLHVGDATAQTGIWSHII